MKTALWITLILFTVFMWWFLITAICNTFALEVKSVSWLLGGILGFVCIGGVVKALGETLKETMGWSKK